MTKDFQTDAVSWLRRPAVMFGALALAAAVCLVAGPQEVQARSRHREAYVERLPRGHNRFHHGGHNYYYHGGHYYRPRGRGFVTIVPPLGVVIPILPHGYLSLVVGGLTYYTYDGVYYRHGPGGYVVVAPPVAAPNAAPGQVLFSVTVAAAALNVRQGPGPGYQIMSVVAQGQSLAVTATAPGWLQVLLPDGRSGWVDQRFTARAAGPSG